MDFKTEQENFWANEFGNEYTIRNDEMRYLTANLSFFSKVFGRIGKPESLIEFGSNIGLNMRAIKAIFPETNLFGIEINKSAAAKLSEVIGKDNIFNGSIFDYESDKKFQISLIKGVLIHINPDMLNTVYEKLYQSSSQYIVISEYYNPTPVEVPYRGHSERLYKRDFAGEMLDKYPDLQLVDYGFCYRRDRAFPVDDTTWFILEKR